VVYFNLGWEEIIISPASRRAGHTQAVGTQGYTFKPSSVTKTDLASNEVVNFSGDKQAVNVSAASYLGSPLALGSIATAFGSNLARESITVNSLPLPISLNGTRVEVGGVNGGYGSARLFFISPTQVNYLIPPETPIGPAKVRITLLSNSSDYSISIQDVVISPVAPGIFTANSNGRGVPAAVVLRVKADGLQVYEPVAVFDQTQNQFIPRPIDLGPEGEQVFMILFGTGFSYRSALSNTNVAFGGENAQVLFAGPRGNLLGLDQLNAVLPRTLAGRGNVDVVVTVDGKPTNTVGINVK
jgi:uncharacterized protein (TIGR03437 family)